MEARPLLTSLAKITSRVPTTWSTARPNVTTSATHSTTSFWIPRTLFSLPALSRSEMSLRCQRLGMCHPSTANWGSFGDGQIKPSTRIKVEMSCPQLTSVDPQGTFCQWTTFQILEKYSACKIINYGAVALQMFTYLLNLMCLNCSGAA